MNIPAVGPGRKDDNGKVRVDLLPAGALMEVGKVLTFGAKKYEAENTWQNVSPFWSRYMAALFRHLLAVMRHGKNAVDEESGLLHMAHLACDALFLLSHLVGHDGGERLPAPPRVPSGLGSVGTVVRPATNVDGPDTNVDAPTTPAPAVKPALRALWHPTARHMTSIPVTSTDPDADPVSYQAEPDPFPPSPKTLRSSPGSRYATAADVVIPKDYHILHMRSVSLVEECRAEDAVSAFQGVQAFEAFAKKGDVVSVIKLGTLIYSREIL